MFFFSSVALKAIRKHSRFADIAPMAFPVTMEIPTSGTDARTWVVEVHFDKPPTQECMDAFVGQISTKTFAFGIFEVARGKVLIIMHSTGNRVINSTCKIALSRLFQSAGVEASIHNVTSLHGYHLELFGWKPVPIQACPRSTPVNLEVTTDDEDEIGDLTSQVASMSNFSQICTDYFTRREQTALALKSDSASSSNTSSVTSVKWVTDMPEEVELILKRKLVESQKLEWIFFRDRVLNGDDTMRTEPSAKHWPAFYTTYAEISHIGDRKNMMKAAFKTFAEHVESSTGNPFTRDDLPKDDVDKVVVHGRCFQCGSSIPLSLEMAGQINTNLGQVVCRAIEDAKVVEDASRFGVFCSRRCVRGRCHGCAGALVDGKCPNEWCGDDQMGNRRRVVPLGFGTNGDMSDEYVKPMEFHFAKRGLPLTWPMCRAKKQCRFHTCLHVCERDCTHDCTGCRQCNGTVKFGSPGCECDPMWLQHQHADDIDPNYDVQEAIYKMVNTIHMQPERPSKKPRT